jgi:23S rRNA pseudouridine2605 synthase
MEYGNTPQNRERIFIVGFLEQKAFNKFSFPNKTKLKKTIHSCLDKIVDEKYYYNNKPLYKKLKNDVVKKDTIYQWRRKYVRENKSNKGISSYQLAKELGITQKSSWFMGHRIRSMPLYIVASSVQSVALASACLSIIRRWAERLIEQGRIEVNNKTASIGDKAQITDTVKIDGRKIDLTRYQEEETKVIILNKQAGVICSNKDEKGRKSVFDLLPKESRWVMVGRLDLNTSGLLLFTNNGDLANKLMRPSSEIDREYAVRVLGKVEPEDLQQLTDGIELDDGFAKFTRVSVGGGQGANRWYKVVLKEGRKREVRRLWESLGFKVSRLIRIRFGEIRLPDNLRANQVDTLKPGQVKLLLDMVNLQK